MVIRGSRALIAITALTTVAIVAGCGGEYRTHQGRPRGFATRPYRLSYPSSFIAMTKDLPQADPEMLPLAVLTENRPIAPNAPQGPTMIIVRAIRLREKDTVQTFMDRSHDLLAARLLDVSMRRVETGPTEQDWVMTAGEGAFAARIIILPREKLAYDIITMCEPAQRAKFGPALQHARDSFTVLPAPR